MFKMKLIINLILAAFFAGCSSSMSVKGQLRTHSGFFVSCPPHTFYCYRKSELICHRGYRVIRVNISEESPEMIVKCN